MFSKKILEDDLKSHKYINSQIKTCESLLKKSIIDLINDDTLNNKEIADEKEAILTLSDELLELKHQLGILDEHMFLNYTNRFTVIPSAPNSGLHSFPHINTIDD